MRVPLPRSRHAPTTLHEPCAMTTSSPLPKNLQYALGKAVLPQDVGSMFGAFAAAICGISTAAPANHKAAVATSHPNLRKHVFMYSPVCL